MLGNEHTFGRQCMSVSVWFQDSLGLHGNLVGVGSLDDVDGRCLCGDDGVLHNQSMRSVCSIMVRAVACSKLGFSDVGCPWVAYCRGYEFHLPEQWWSSDLILETAYLV